MAQPFCLLLMLVLMVPFLAAIRPYKIIDDEYTEQSKYTIDLDLPTSGILSTLMLMVKARTATTGVVAGPWIKYLISSVSLNQAGQAFLNAAPPEAFQADAYYKTGRMARRGYQVMGGAASEVIEEVPILFGEGVNDLEHTIDLSKLNDPKLSVTYDLATTGPTGETCWATGYYPRFTVIAHLLQGAGIPASKGYHSLRQIESYTPADSEKHKLELKGARPIRRIYCALDLDNPCYGWIHSLDEVLLHGDNMQWVPFDMMCDDWQELIRDLFGLCEVKAEVYYAKGGYVVDTCVDRRMHLDINSPYDEANIYRAYGGSGRTIALKQTVIADGTHPEDVARLTYDFAGICPWSIQPIDMPKMLGMDHLDPTEHAPVYLELDHVSNASDIGGPVKIYIEDLAR